MVADATLQESAQHWESGVMVSSLVAGDAEAVTTSQEMVRPEHRCWRVAQRSS